MATPIPIWRRLLVHWVTRALCLERIMDGKSMLARMEMIAITTSSSINVKPMLLLQCDRIVRFFE